MVFTLLATCFFGVAATILSSAAQNTTLAGVEDAFRSSSVVPDVLPNFDPKALLNVVFTDAMNQQQVDVTPGLDLTMQQTHNEPKFSISFNGTAFRNGTFVLSIVDPDAPTPQNRSISQYLHFLGGGFKINGTLLVNTSTALLDFVPPAPPNGSDPHRYVAVLYNQPSNFLSVAPRLANASTPRPKFNLSAFALDAGLGSPIAGNFFKTGPANTSSTGAPTTSNGRATAQMLWGTCFINVVASVLVWF